MGRGRGQLLLHNLDIYPPETWIRVCFPLILSLDACGMRGKDWSFAFRALFVFPTLHPLYHVPESQ